MRCLLMLPLLLFAALASPQNPPPRAIPQAAAVHRPSRQKSEAAKQQANTEQVRNESSTNRAKGPSSPNDLWDLSAKIAVIASIVAFLQFLALVLTVFVMVRNGQRQLRAYVLPENAGIGDGTMLNPPQPARANVPGVFMLIKNSGQTPAYKVASWAQIAVIPVGNENIALGVPPIPERFYNTLGSGGTFSKALWFDRALSANEIADVATGVRAIYLYGRIEYTDAFKKRRFANFRLRYTGQFPPLPGAILNFSETGNDAN